MASSSKLISILFLFALFSMQIHAREFFSKIPTANTDEKETTTTTTREQEHGSETTQNSEEQEPRFVPETQNGYGLYGHGTGTEQPGLSTKETYEPYVTPVKYQSDEPYNSIPESSSNNNNAYQSTEQQNLGNARFTQKGWSTRDRENQNNNNNYYYNSNNGYNNGEKQGMSDTRYLENGKYYYDVKSENNYYPNQFHNTRGVSSRNEFNENRYNMRRYNQNQEEFEDTQEDFEP